MLGLGAQMHYKRKRAKKRARCYSNPPDWSSKGNAWDRFRVKDYARKVADMEEMAFDAQLCIRVVLNDADPTAPGIEMYRIPVEGLDFAPLANEARGWGDGLRGSAQRSVLAEAKRMFEFDPLVREVRARHGDVEVRLDVMLDEVRQKRGLEAVAPLVEHVVSRLAEEFAGRKEVPPTLCCPTCLKEIDWKDWDEEWNACKACRWDEMEEDDGDWGSK